MDIKLAYNNDTGYADWVLVNGSVVAGDDLESAIMVSLFTDGYASDDFALWPGTTDRRGWWANTYEDDPIGSNLWQLDRAKFTDYSHILLRARDYSITALRWLIDDGIAQSVTVIPARLNRDAISLTILVQRPNVPTPQTFRYSVYWDQIVR